MKWILATLIGLCFTSAFAQSSDQPYRFTSEKLRVMDGDVLKKHINRYLAEARKIRSETMVAKEGDSEEKETEGRAEAREYIKDALKIILSKPVIEGLETTYLETIRGELSDGDEYAKAMAQVTGEAVRIINDKSQPLKFQNTALTVLENALSELKPQLNSQESFKTIVQKIAEADISISDELKNYKELNSMDKTDSPSKVAKNLLKDLEKKNLSNKENRKEKK